MPPTIAISAKIMPGSYVAQGVIIKNDVFIGHNVVILNHLSLGGNTTINENAEIGANSTIYPGVSIGVNAVVKPGSVVKRSVPPWAIAEGNPARISDYKKTCSSGFEIATNQISNEIKTSKVKGVCLYKFKMIPDMRGNLVVGEFAKEIPFIPKRFFLVYDVPSSRVDIRGDHAHKNCEQFLVAVRGSINVITDDGCNREEFNLNQPYIGIHIPSMIWAVQYRHSDDAALMVFCSHFYDHDDYIRDYSIFQQLTQKNIS